MRFIMTFVWSFLLVTMLNYVAGSIGNYPFELLPGAIISVIVALFIIFIAESFPKDEVADH